MKHIDVTRELANERPYGHYTMTLRDKNGNIIQEGTYRVHSFINQYWAILRNTMRSIGFASYRRIDDLADSSLTHLRMRSGNGGTEDARGIVVGTSSAAVAYSQLGLGGFIQSGNSTGQLLYGAGTVGYDPATGKATLSQTFTNNTAGDIDVNEVGIAVDDSTAELGCVLLVRDVPGSTFAVLPMAVLTVSYEIQFPFGTQNFAMLFARHQIARNTDNIELYNATGTLVSNATFGSGTGAFGFTSDLGDDTRGVIVGTGSGAEAFNTFALDTQIAHGTNAGELFHYDSTISSLEVDTTITNSSCFYISRAFRNKSGSAVNISEIGIASNATIGATNYSYLFDRRVLASEIEVADNETVTVTWAYKYNFI